jgi:hypothetical protein
MATAQRKSRKVYPKIPAGNATASEILKGIGATPADIRAGKRALAAAKLRLGIKTESAAGKTNAKVSGAVRKTSKSGKK